MPEESPKPTPLTAPPERQGGERLRSFARSKIAQGLGIATLALSALSAAGGEYYADDPLFVPNQIIDIATNYGAEPVDPAIVRMINKRASEPTPAPLDKLHKSLDKAATKAYDPNPELLTLAERSTIAAKRKHGAKTWDELFRDYKNDYFDYCIVQAEHFGLHISDSRPFAQRLDQAQSAEDAIEILQHYTKTLGIDTRLHTDKDLKDIHMPIEPLTSEPIKMNDELKQGIASFMFSMSFAPKELYDFAQIKEIRIVQSLGAMDNSVVGKAIRSGEANPITGILYLPIQYLYDGSFENAMHETAHRVDYRMNGNSLIGTQRDRNFTKLNQKAFRYGTRTTSTNSNVAETYGATDPWEDKAVLMQTMLNGLDEKLLYSRSPVVRAKYRLLLGRLEQNIPGYAQYLLGISNHKSSQTK